MHNGIWLVYQNTTVTHDISDFNILNNLMLKHFELKNKQQIIIKDLIKSVFICTNLSTRTPVYKDTCE